MMKQQRTLGMMVKALALCLAMTGASQAEDAPTAPAAAAPAVKVAVTDSSFRCMRKMTAVRHFYVDNLLGDIKGTLAAANAPKGAPYPPGSVVQLVPTEVMVKREPGFSPPT